MRVRRGRHAPDEEFVIGDDPFDPDDFEDDDAGDSESDYVIGNVPAPPVRAPARSPFAAPPAAGQAYEPDDEDLFDDGSYDDDEYVIDDYYDDQEPARQPLFYVFLALAVLVGGLFVFLLISLATGDDDSDPVSEQAAGIEISVDTPATGDRFEVGKDIDVIVRARASEPVVRFELYRGTNVVDRVTASAPGPDDVYSAVLKMRFEAKGEFPFFVRVITESGAHRDSKEVKLVVFQPVNEQPPVVKGKALTLVTLRIGPGDEFASAGQLQPQEEVDIIGKTRGGDWLLVNRGGGLWVKTSGIQALDSLALVRTTDPTPTPAPPTRTATPGQTTSPSPSGTPSPTVPANAPDFIPASAALADGGARLRVTVANIAPNAYSGPLVVSVADIGAGGTLAKVFNVTLAANGSAVVEFELNPPVTTQKTARVTVDPDLSVPEANEDNNTASFGLTPPADPPDLVIAGAEVGAVVTVTIKNVGGALASTAVTVRVRMAPGGPDAGKGAETSLELALAKNQVSAPISVQKPGTGAATVQVIVSGQVVASRDIDLP